MSHISSGENDYRYPPPVPRDKRVDTGDVEPRTTYDLSTGGATYPETGPYRRQTEGGLQPVTGHIRPGHRVRPRTTSRAIAPRTATRGGSTGRPPVRPQAQAGGLIAKAVIGVLGVLLLAGAVGWLLNRGGDDATEDVTEQTETTVLTEGSEEASGDAGLTTTTVQLTPAALPEITEPGLVLYQMKLLDAYTGTGSSGTAELYMNAKNGQICHVFDVNALGGQYAAFVNQAFFPREGPSVINLGATTNSMSQCVSASPIEVARAMTNPAEFYVAAIDLDGKILLRGQLDEATVSVDNRDEQTISNQLALSDGDGSSEDSNSGIFDNENDGAYIEINDRTVTFRGAVPDQATADSLLAAFVQLTGRGVDVVDELVVEAGAPDPSGRVVIGDSLLFAVDDDQIAGEPVVLQTLADLLRVNPTWAATVTGHTDNDGLRAYNIDLSLRRANTVRSRLADLGVDESRIRVEGFGPDRPIGDNNTNAGRASNRRIEITIDS